jgi:cation transport ATPase
MPASTAAPCSSARCISWKSAASTSRVSSPLRAWRRRRRRPSTRPSTAAGVVAVADTLKEDSPRAVRALRDLGVEVVMITGDSRRTAEAVARQVAIGRVLAEVLPDDKARDIRRLQQEGKVVG